MPGPAGRTRSGRVRTLRSTGEDEAVRELTHRARVDGAERQPPDAGVQPVRAQDEVVVVGRAVVELDDGVVPVDRQVDRLRTPRDRHVAGAGQQRCVQVRAGQGQAGADPAPHLVHAKLEQEPATVVGEALPLDPVGPLGDLGLEAELAKRAYGVAGKVDPGARTGRRCGPLDQPHGRAGAVQGPGRRQPGQAGADDEHPKPLELHQHPPSRPSEPSPGAMFWLIRKRLWGS